MNRKRWILLLLALLILWAIYQAEQKVVTAVAAVATVALVFWRYTFLWPVVVVGWLLSGLWGSDFLRSLFGKLPKGAQPVNFKPNGG